jgi:hypothetical protein
MTSELVLQPNTSANFTVEGLDTAVIRFMHLPRFAEDHDGSVEMVSDATTITEDMMLDCASALYEHWMAPSGVNAMYEGEGWFAQMIPLSELDGEPVEFAGMFELIGSQ